MILCLDLGTRSGWALTGGSGGNVLSGVWDFRPDRFDGAGMRYLKFRRQLDDFAKSIDVTAVYFEEVRRHLGADAARVYGALFGVVTAWCEENKIPYEGVPVGTIKKFWTGHGNASKDEMIATAREYGYAPADDNEADALAIAHYVVSKGVAK